MNTGILKQQRHDMTPPDIQEELNKRIICLREIIRRAESSRRLVEWIGSPDNLKKVSWGGYGSLFGHIQYIAYSDFILSTVALFERDKKSSSFRALFNFICKNESVLNKTGLPEGIDTKGLCNTVEKLRQRLPIWPRNGFEATPESIDHALDVMKQKRDELIAHHEFKGLMAPISSFDMVTDGCGLLPLAMDLYPAICQIVSPSNMSCLINSNEFSNIQDIAKKLENVVTGHFEKIRHSPEEYLKARKDSP